VNIQQLEALEALGQVVALDATRLGPFMARAQSVTTAKGVPLYAVENGVAVITIEGPLAKKALAYREWIWFDGYDRIGAAIAKAANDTNVDVVAFRIESPGGAAMGLPDAAREMRAALDASGKPSIAYLDLGASAAYWLATVADEIYVPNDGAAGSIGTYTTHYDLSQSLEKAGVKITRVQDPEGKTAGDWIRPLDEEGLARLQEVVSMLSEGFYEQVATRRGLTTKAVRELNAKVFYGQKAVEAKLADGVLQWSGVTKRAGELAQKRKDKRMADMATFLGLDPKASAEEVQKAADEAKPLLELGRKTLQMTGETSAEAASGVVAAWKKDAAETASMRATLKQNERNAEASERHSLLVQLAQVELPSHVWKDATNQSAGPVEELAEMSTGALRAYVGRRSSKAVPPALRASEEAKSGEVTEAEIKAYAKANGIKNLEIAKQALLTASAEGNA